MYTVQKKAGRSREFGSVQSWVFWISGDGDGPLAVKKAGDCVGVVFGCGRECECRNYCRYYAAFQLNAWDQNVSGRLIGA
jgi:hypothetical protein